jgi:arginine repressor
MLTYADICVIKAYVHTGRIINITVSPGNAFEAARLLNYLTAPNVLVTPYQGSMKALLRFY